MPANEEEVPEGEHDWLERRQGLDRHSLERAEEELDATPEPGIGPYLSRLRMVVGTPLRLVANGMRRLTGALRRDRAEDEHEQPLLADGDGTTGGRDHYVGTRTGHPTPSTEPVIEDQSEFNWGAEANDAHAAADD